MMAEVKIMALAFGHPLLYLEVFSLPKKQKAGQICPAFRTGKLSNTLG
jgi:hypothetical protein